MLATRPPYVSRWPPGFSAPPSASSVTGRRGRRTPTITSPWGACHPYRRHPSHQLQRRECTRLARCIRSREEGPEEERGTAHQILMHRLPLRQEVAFPPARSSGGERAAARRRRRRPILPGHASVKKFSVSTRIPMSAHV